MFECPLTGVRCDVPTEYLLHAPCMRTVQRGYEVCADEYLSQMDLIGPAPGRDTSAVLHTADQETLLVGVLRRPTRPGGGFLSTSYS